MTLSLAAVRRGRVLQFIFFFFYSQTQACRDRDHGGHTYAPHGLSTGRSPQTILHGKRAGGSRAAESSLGTQTKTRGLARRWPPQLRKTADGQCAEQPSRQLTGRRANSSLPSQHMHSPDPELCSARCNGPLRAQAEEVEQLEGLEKPQSQVATTTGCRPSRQRPAPARPLLTPFPGRNIHRSSRHRLIWFLAV